MTTTIIISLASLISGFFMGYWTSYYKTKGGKIAHRPENVKFDSITIK